MDNNSQDRLRGMLKKREVLIEYNADLTKIDREIAELRFQIIVEQEIHERKEQQRREDEYQQRKIDRQLAAEAAQLQAYARRAKEREEQMMRQRREEEKRQRDEARRQAVADITKRIHKKHVMVNKIKAVRERQLAVRRERDSKVILNADHVPYVLNDGTQANMNKMQTLVVYIHATERTPQLQNKYGYEQLINIRHKAAIPVTHTFSDDGTIRDQLIDLIHSKIAYSDYNTTDIIMFYYFDDATIYVNEQDKRLYVSKIGAPIKTGQYRPLKYDEAHEKLYATVGEQFTFQIMNQRHLQANGQELCSKYVLNQLIESGLIGEVDVNKVYEHVELTDILEKNDTYNKVFIVNESNGFVSERSHQYQLFMKHEHVYISQQHKNLFKEPNQLRAEIHNKLEDADVILNQTVEQKTTFINDDEQEIECVVDRWVVKANLDDMFRKLYSERYVPYTICDAAGNIQLILTEKCLFMTQDQMDIIQTNMKIFGKPHMYRTLLPLLSDFTHPQETKCVSINDCYKFMPILWSDTDANEKWYFTIDHKKSYLKALCSCKELRYPTYAKLVNKKVELHEFTPVDGRYYYFQICSDQKITEFNTQLLQVTNIIGKDVVMLLQDIIHEKVTINIIYEYSTMVINAPIPRFDTFIRYAELLQPENPKRLIVSTFGLLQKQTNTFMSYNYVDENDNIKQEHVHIYKPKYESNAQFVHCQMANQFLINLLGDYRDRIEDVVQIKTDCVSFKQAVPFNDELYKVVDYKKYVSRYLNTQPHHMYNKRVYQCLAGTGKTTMIVNEAKSINGKFPQARILIVVKDNNCKIDFKDVKGDIMCYQRFQKFKNMYMLDDYDYIFVDEFEMVDLDFLRKLIFEYICREGQHMMLCGDVFQQTNFGSCEVDGYKFILELEGVQHMTHNWRNKIDYLTQAFTNGVPDYNKCIDLMRDRGMLLSKADNIVQLFEQGYTFIFESNDEAFQINEQYQQWVANTKTENYQTIIKDVYSKDRIDWFDGHRDCQYTWQGHKVQNICGCAYTCFSIQSKGFWKLKVGKLRTREQAYVALSRLRETR